MSHAGVEQRSEAREEFLSGQLLVVDLLSDGSAFRTHGVVLNISTGGMAVQTFRPLVQGRISQIQLSLPKASFSTGNGLVAWQKPGGLAGIRFLNAPLQTLPKICQQVEQDSPQDNSDSALSLFTWRNRSGTNAFETTLHLFACSAMSLTGATGVAIALGNSHNMECRASVGSAPDVGTKLDPESGLSGHSMSTGAIILCKDAQSDARVNMAAVQQMNARSIVIIPIAAAEGVIGLLETFSQDKNFFSERHVEKLQPLVNVLAEAIHEQTASPSEAPVAATALGAEAVLGKQLRNDLQGADSGQLASPSETFHTDDSNLFPTVQRENPAPTNFEAYSRFTDRSQAVAVAFGVMAVLLLFIAIAWLASRNRTNSARHSNPSNGIQQGAQQPSVGANHQEAVSTAKPSIAFDPAVINQKVGATFSVNVVLKGAKDVWSVPMQIFYDSQKLEVITVKSGSMLSRDGQAATLVHRVDSSASYIDISLSRPLSAPGISGDGVVFTVVFLSKGSGVSRLHVDHTGLRDTSTKEISANSSDAIITISQSTNPVESVGEQSATKARTLPLPSTASSQNTAPVISAPEVQVHNEIPEAIPEKPLAINETPPPVQPPARTTELKIPSVAPAAITLVPRSPGVPSFVLDRTLNGHTNWVTAVAFSADGQHLVSGSWDRSVKSWDIAAGHATSTLASKGAGIQTSALSHDGQLIAAEDAANNINIWNASTGKDVRTIKGDRTPWDRKSWVYSIAFSPDDRLVAAALDSKTVRLWDVSSGRAVRDFTGRSREFIYVAISPNGRWLATGDGSKTIDLWDVDTGKISKILKGHKQDIYAVAFSPDGRWLASSSKDKTVKVWEVSTGRELHTLTGHKDSVTSLAFSPNGRWLASSSWDKTIKIWDVEAGREVQTLTGHTHPIYSLAFDPHSGRLATGSADGTIKLWRLRKELDLAVLVGQHDPQSTATATSVGRER